jgi:hypothetical protein
MKPNSISGNVIILTLSCILTNSCALEETPSVRTHTITEITGSSANITSEVLSEGTYPVTARGICWSTNKSPSLADNYTHDGKGPGTYTSSLGGLSYNTTFYVSAYAINQKGTGYGAPVSFTTAGAPSSVGNLPATEIRERSASENHVDGITTSNVNALISGLDITIKYHFRAKAENALGTIKRVQPFCPVLTAPL